MNKTNVIFILIKYMHDHYDMQKYMLLLANTQVQDPDNFYVQLKVTSSRIEFLKVWDVHLKKNFSRYEFENNRSFSGFFHTLTGWVFKIKIEFYIENKM